MTLNPVLSLFTELIQIISFKLTPAPARNIQSFQFQHLPQSSNCINSTQTVLSSIVVQEFQLVLLVTVYRTPRLLFVLLQVQPVFLPLLVVMLTKVTPLPRTRLEPIGKTRSTITTPGILVLRIVKLIYWCQLEILIFQQQRSFLLLH